MSMDTLARDDSPLSLDAFLRQPPRDASSNGYLERQQARESNARSYPRRIPLALQQGKGIYVRDTAGQIFIDCLAGAGALALGHHHAAPIAAIRAALDAGLPLQTLDLTTPIKDRFVETLFAALPCQLGRNGRIHFCGPTGADGVEAAIKLAKTATGRHGVFAFSGAYHGMTHGTLGISGNHGPKAQLGALGGGVQFLPYPYTYRCPFGLGGEAGVDASLNLLDHLLDDPESGVLKPAAVVVEVVQGEGGVIPAPLRWLRGLREITRRHGVVLILDEVQTGLGRTGAMFAFEHASIEPDAIVLSKAIGGGLPLSVVIYNEALDQWAPGAHAGTFRGNQLAMAAGTATIDVVLREGLAAHAARMGERLLAALGIAQQEMPWVGDVRGCGLMLGIEIVDECGTPNALGSRPGDRARALQIQRRALESGLIIELGGRHGAVLRLLPPLIISPVEVDVVAERLLCSLRGDACNTRSRRACGSLMSPVARSDRAVAATAGASAPGAPQEPLK